MSEEILRLPYLHDHHSHVSLYAAFEGIPDLAGMDLDHALNLLASLPEDRLSIVKGWRTDKLPLGDRELGATMAMLPPAIIVNASLHGFLATKRAAPSVAALWPELAENADDPSWGERNLPRLFSFYGRVAGFDAGKLGSFIAKVEAAGLGSLEDMTLISAVALSIESASAFAGRIASWAAPDVFFELEDARSVCAGVKLFLDGSLGARTAALDAPFSDGSTGSLLYTDEALSATIAELAPLCGGLSIHAIGHMAIEQAVRVLDVSRNDGVDLPPIRLEHVQFIDLPQARRCKDAGIVLSMQPNFNSDSRDYADRLIPRHRAENDPFRMLIDQAGFVPGADLVFGSDGMPHGPEEALMWSLYPEFAGQVLSPGEFLAGYGVARGLDGEGSVFAIDAGARAIRRIS